MRERSTPATGIRTAIPTWPTTSTTWAGCSTIRETTAKRSRFIVRRWRWTGASWPGTISRRSPRAGHQPRQPRQLAPRPRRAWPGRATLPRGRGDVHAAGAVVSPRSPPEPVALNAAATFPLIGDALSDRHRASGSASTCGPTRRSGTRVRPARRGVTSAQVALITAATDDSIRKAWDGLQTMCRACEQLIMAPAPKDPGDRGEARELNRLIDMAELELLPQLPALKHDEDLAKLAPTPYGNSCPLIPC